jgi:PEP-CTERM motif
MLYGIDYNPGSASQFYSVNTSTGVITRVGSTGLIDLADLTSNQVLTIWEIQANTDDLVTISYQTGIGTAGPTITGAGLSASVPIYSIAWDPVTGVLYGTTSQGAGATADTLYSINPATGAATFIGKIGFNDVYALGFGQDGTLYGVENADDNGGLVNINLTTGVGTLVGNTGVQGIFDIASDPAGSGFFAAESNTFALYKLNAATAVATEVGSYQSFANVAGLAFVDPGAATPEPNSIALITAGLGLIGLAVRRGKNGARQGDSDLS